MKLFDQQRRSIVQHQADWQTWQHQNLGKSLLQQEKDLLSPFIKKKLGTHLFQVSIAGCVPLYDSSPMPYQTFAQISCAGQTIKPDANCGLLLEPCFLPIANDALDGIILHHILEYSHNPHQILREAHRALASGGQLFVVNFNPWSLMGLRRICAPFSKAPWSGNYRSTLKLCDWLKLLGFNVELIQYAFFKLPINAQQSGSRDSKTERLGQKYNCFFGSTYAIVARKQTAGMIPLSETKIKRRVLTFPVTEPTTRSIKSLDA